MSNDSHAPPSADTPRFLAIGFGCRLTMSLAACLACAQSALAAENPPKKIVFIAGTVHQGPGGHPAGTHEYELTARLLKRALATAENVSNVTAEVHVGGWPSDPRTLDDADTIVVISDGADRSAQDHPLLVGDHLQVLKKQMDRGCGLVAIHWTVFVPQTHGGPEFLHWIGGYFDYESGDAANHWYSKIQTASTTPEPASLEHPICRGLAPFALREEYYYNIRFPTSDPRPVPILKTHVPGESAEQVVAWALQRDDGGRGFGFTGGHFFDNWGVDGFRRMVLNAILWTAHAEVPAGGVRSAPPKPAQPPVAAGEPAIQALIVTGHQHPVHVWRETTVALQDALAQDRRIQVTVVTDPEFLATKNLFSYGVVVFNYCNWQRGGLSPAAQENFKKYLREGGGLTIIHFSNGAFHASLPETPPSDWPEYREICRRVWDHAPGRSSHDPFGRFTVNIAADHPITEGMNSFETIDELYCNQQGDQPIEILATARSTVTGKDEPMAFVYPYGKGRIFQTVLGHAAESIRAPGEAALIRRGTVWAAGQPQRAVAPAPQKSAASAPKLIPEGRFGSALDPRQRAAWAPRKTLYDKRPLTVECCCRLAGKTGFNILVANNDKQSADHWELYSYAGTGELSLFLPGFLPAEIRSGVEITDNHWHHVAASFDEQEAVLYVDGKAVKRSAIKRERSGGPVADLYFGGYPPHKIGCDGLVDEVRISDVRRDIGGAASAPCSADEHTIGLWHFDRIEAGKVEDESHLRNSAVADGLQPVASRLLARRTADPAHKLISIDTSPDESFLSLRLDTMGRLFVGGREALFVYEPDEAGGYQPRQLLYRFPPDTWITDVLVRGEDLYVMTNAALYLLPGGRTQREHLVPRRLLWGTPVDLHVTWHGLAWGPEGDLYFSSGDPLLNYGDFQNRPDHWGHWTLRGPGDTQIPYTGVGGFFRCHPDGSGFRVMAGGTRGAVGIAFDRRWNLFSNDNDHESIADRYSPARLLHVSPRAHFFWPRGWIAGMSPERSDLLDVVNAGMGREAPVGQAYYDEPWLGPKYRDSLLVARWGQRKVDGFALAPHGASFTADEFPLLIGEETARPVGVAVGRGGRVFVSISYMAGNEWSPKYPSEVLLITRADDSTALAFEPYDAPAADPKKLWQELSSASCWRRQQAHTEILRRGGPLLGEAIGRLRQGNPRDPAMLHLPWLAAASGRPEALAPLIALANHADPQLRATAIRALGAFQGLKAPAEVFRRALADSNLQVQHAAVVALFERTEELPDEMFAGPARSRDTYLRQASAFLIAQSATPGQLQQLLGSKDALARLAGVLAAGFALTVPSPLAELPPELPLRYDSTNALFVIPYADATVDLKQLGRIGSFTIAQRWKTVEPTSHERQLFESLLQKLADQDERVQFQAGYFLSLLDDPRANRLVAEARRARILAGLNGVTKMAVREAWMAGPFDDGKGGFDTVHSPESGPIDLTSSAADGSRRIQWQAVSADEFTLPVVSPGIERASSYLYFRLQSLQPQNALLTIDGAGQLKLWHNGRPVESSSPVVLAIEAGSNDLLVRVGQLDNVHHVSLSLQAGGPLEATLPEKLAPSALAERLRNAGTTAQDRVSEEFLSVDWTSAAERGDPERGRRLFGISGLGCAKCHAVLPGQKGGGAPSLAGAAARFTVAHVVESVLMPGKQVAPVFGTTTVATGDGKTFAGLAIEEDQRQLVLLLPNASRQVILKSDIDQRKLQPTSPMPSGLVKTPAELGDLLAYLMSDHPQAP